MNLKDEDRVEDADRIENEINDENNDNEGLTEDVVSDSEVITEDELNDSEDDLSGDEMVDTEDGQDTQLVEETEVLEQLPKKKINFKKIAAIGLSVILIATAGTFGYKEFDQQSKSYAVTFEGKKYSVEDYKLYLLFQGEAEDAQKNALAALTDSLIIKKNAVDQGIKLTDAENKQVLEDTKNLKEIVASNGQVMPNVTEERLVEIVSSNMYFSKILDAQSKAYKVDEADFTKEFDNYLVNSKQDYMDVKLKYIVTKTKEEATAARSKAQSGTPIDEVIKKYSFDFDPAKGVQVIPMKSIQLSPEDLEAVLKLKVSGLTDVIALEGAFVVFYVNEMNIPTEQQVKDNFRKAYTQKNAYEILQADLIKWRGATEVKVNQKALDALK
jgi:hypothetical protein